MTDAKRQMRERCEKITRPLGQAETYSTDQAYIGLGSNQGDSVHILKAAVQALADLPQTRLWGCSQLYSSAPVDASGPDFLNAVVGLKTALTPLALLAALQAIEAQFGRQRPYVNAPRTLDLDLLCHGQTVMHVERLTLPHPRMHERAFVLMPLLELAPTLVIPGLGFAQDFLPAVSGQAIQKINAVDLKPAV
jgi:2-amino-4-hydroxy-6-hydroxymethyldihydropteridine diphosphokinase